MIESLTELQEILERDGYILVPAAMSRHAQLTSPPSGRNGDGGDGCVQIEDPRDRRSRIARPFCTANNRHRAHGILPSPIRCRLPGC
jgi:hypothetical protein